MQLQRGIGEWCWKQRFGQLRRTQPDKSKTRKDVLLIHA